MLILSWLLNCMPTDTTVNILNNYKTLPDEFDIILLPDAKLTTEQRIPQNFPHLLWQKQPSVSGNDRYRQSDGYNPAPAEQLSSKTKQQQQNLLTKASLLGMSLACLCMPLSNLG